VRVPQFKLRWSQIITIAAGAVGGAVAIALMEMLAERTTVPLLFVPFATSIVLVMGSPEAEPAQPRALVGGHLVSAAVGLLLLQVTGPGPWAAATAVGLAIIAMHATRTFHPPRRHRSAGHRCQQHAAELFHRPGRGGCVPAGRVRVYLAQGGAPRLLAIALVVTRASLRGHHRSEPTRALGGTASCDRHKAPGWLWSLRQRCRQWRRRMT
jgi:hypothetical protein